MAVIENQTYRVIANGLYLPDTHLIFPELKGFLARAVTTYFGRRGIHTQIFERQFEARAIVEGHIEHTRARS